MRKELCCFNARNKTNGNIVVMEYEFKGGKYYWINSKGYKAGSFDSLNELKGAVIECGYTKWKGFKWLF